MLTYETLRKIANDEKIQANLSKLPDNFFKDVNTYITKKSQLSTTEEENWELDSVIQTLNEIFERRERKIVNFALDSAREGTTHENLTEVEEDVFNKIVSALNEFKMKRRKIMEYTETETIVTTQDIPSFVGTDMKIYGPFKQGDMAMVPKTVAKILIEKNSAKKMDI